MLITNILNENLYGGINSPVRENYESINDFLDTSIIECYETFYNAQNSLYVCDSIATEQLIIGNKTKSEEIVREAKEGFFTKIKNGFKKLWEKIKMWFRKIKVFFVSLFTSNKKFIQKHKDEILKKVNKLKSYDIDIKNYNADAMCDNIKKISDKIYGSMEDADFDNIISDLREKKRDKFSASLTNDAIVADITNNKCGTLSEMKEYFYKLAGFDTKTVTVDASFVKNIISESENLDKHVKDIDKFEEKFNKFTKKALEKLEKSDDEVDQNFTKYLRTLTNVSAQLFKIGTSYINDASSQIISIARQVYKKVAIYKNNSSSTTESFSNYYDSDNLFESVYRSL